MSIFLILSVSLFVIGLFLLVFLIKRQKGLGILQKNRIYADSTMQPGFILQSTTIPLRGKPDYVIEDGDSLIPVEVKTGKTPREPYLNHTMQVMAYCLLVEEQYSVLPKGGIIKYPGAEFKVGYTKEAEIAVRQLVNEILVRKQSGEELSCKHIEHN